METNKKNGLMGRFGEKGTKRENVITRRRKEEINGAPKGSHNEKLGLRSETGGLPVLGFRILHLEDLAAEGIKDRKVAKRPGTDGTQDSKARTLNPIDV